MPVVLQNKFSGVNQQELPTKGQNFSEFDGCFPDYVGTQNRNYGKILLHKMDNPVYGIFQYWTPVGRSIAILQTFSDVSLAKWKFPSFKIPFNTFNTAVSINDTALPTPVGQYYNDSGFLDGAGGGNPTPKWHLVKETLPILDFLVEGVMYRTVVPGFSQLLQNCNGYFPDASEPFCEPFDYPVITPASSPSTVDITPFDLSGGFVADSLIALSTNFFPPANYLITKTQQDTISTNAIGLFDFTNLTGKIVKLTLTTVSVINGNTFYSETPFNAKKEEETVINVWPFLKLNDWIIKTEINDINGKPLNRHVVSEVGISFTELNIYRSVKSL